MANDVPVCTYYSRYSFITTITIIIIIIVIIIIIKKQCVQDRWKVCFIE